MTIQEWLGKDNEIGISIWERKYQHNGEDFETWLNRVSGNKENIKENSKICSGSMSHLSSWACCMRTATWRYQEIIKIQIGKLLI